MRNEAVRRKETCASLGFETVAEIAMKFAANLSFAKAYASGPRDHKGLNIALGRRNLETETLWALRCLVRSKKSEAAALDRHRVRTGQADQGPQKRWESEKRSVGRSHGPIGRGPPRGRGRGRLAPRNPPALYPCLRFQNSFWEHGDQGLSFLSVFFSFACHRNPTSKLPKKVDSPGIFAGAGSQPLGGLDPPPLRGWGGVRLKKGPDGDSRGGGWERCD